MANLMRRIDEVARAEHARRVVAVSVRLGPLSHMSAGHFAEHFQRAAVGTLAEGARLEVVISDDIHHAMGQDILLEKLEVEV